MKTVLYYFTGTGNSLIAARRISDRIPDCEMRPIVQEMKSGQFQSDAKRLIFLFPLYFLSFPKIVLDFINAFEFEEDVQIICVSTRGFRPMGGVIAHFRKILKAKVRTLRMGFYIDMPSNDVTLFNIHTQDKQKKLLSSSQTKMDFIVESIKKGRPYFDPEPLGFMRFFRYKPAYINRLGTSYRKFYVQESCTGCGICKNVCPLENVTLEDKKPVWHENCQLCEACINYCPQKAIQFGKSTTKKGRYTHPLVSFREIAAQKPGQEV